jgi:hypothetical protein
VVKVKVTETHKWHITGHITDANPEILHVDSAQYFAECEKKRQEREAESDY